MNAGIYYSVVGLLLFAIGWVLSYWLKPWEYDTKWRTIVCIPPINAGLISVIIGISFILFS